MRLTAHVKLCVIMETSPLDQKLGSKAAGYPFIDACMRALKQRGWINFRMRAMLVSFASYHLWLDWRLFRDWLACQFIDYEPGIHYSQIQMQSGLTGINTLRIYNPVKQGMDHDPAGVFIREWVPELKGIVGEAIHQPWLYQIKCSRNINADLGVIIRYRLSTTRSQSICARTVCNASSTERLLGLRPRSHATS